MNLNKFENLKIENIQNPDIAVKKGVDFVYEQNPELINIGSKEQYSRYLDTIFPDSKVRDIVYHGSQNIEKFDNFNIGDTDNKKSFGIYFGNRYSHYAGEGYHHSICALLNITNPRIINNISLSDKNTNVVNNEATGLGSADATNIKLFYNIINEDGIIQLGHFNGNDAYSYDETIDIYNNAVVELFKKIQGDINNFDDYFELLLKDNTLQLELHNKIKEMIKNKPESFDSDLYQELVVFNPDQINILGSKKDLENFKNFVEKK
jgi:hypothetical protein